MEVHFIRSKYFGVLRKISKQASVQSYTIRIVGAMCKSKPLISTFESVKLEDEG